jgi:hypothetical protein
MGNLVFSRKWKMHFRLTQPYRCQTVGKLSREKKMKCVFVFEGDYDYLATKA